MRSLRCMLCFFSFKSLRLRRPSNRHARVSKPHPLLATYPDPDPLDRRGKWSRVVEILDDMRREGLSPDRVTFSTAIAAVGASGQWETATSLLAEMKEAGVSPDAVSRFTIIAFILGRLAYAINRFTGHGQNAFENTEHPWFGAPLSLRGLPVATITPPATPPRPPPPPVLPSVVFLFFHYPCFG